MSTGVCHAPRQPSGPDFPAAELQLLHVHVRLLFFSLSGRGLAINTQPATNQFCAVFPQHVACLVLQAAGRCVPNRFECPPCSEELGEPAPTPRPELTQAATAIIAPVWAKQIGSRRGSGSGLFRFSGSLEFLDLCQADAACIQNETDSPMEEDARMGMRTWRWDLNEEVFRCQSSRWPFLFFTFFLFTRPGSPLCYPFFFRCVASSISMLNFPMFPATRERRTGESVEQPGDDSNGPRTLDLLESRNALWQPRKLQTIAIIEREKYSIDGRVYLLNKSFDFGVEIPQISEI